MLDFRPTSDYYTMAIYAFHQSFQISEYGLGAAIAVVMVAVHVRGDTRLPPADGQDGGGAVTSGTQIAPTPIAPIVPRKIGRRRRVRKLGWNVLGLLVLVVMVFPVYWMVATAFKPGQQILSYTPQWFPTPPTLSNFRDAINQPFFWHAVKNSLIIVTAVVALSVVLAFLASLALAKFHFYGRKAFIVLILGVQMVPLAALIIPLYILMSRLGPGRQADRRDRDVPDVRAAVHRLDDAGFPARHSERARGGCHGRRGDTLRRLRAGPPATCRTGPRRDIDLRLHPGLERVHHRVCVPAHSRETDADGLACIVHDTARNGVGPLMAGATLCALRSSSSSCSSSGGSRSA